MYDHGMSEPAMLKRSKLSTDEISVARRLRLAREEDGFSLRELASDSDLTKSALMHYETGAAPLSFGAGNSVCQRLDLNQRWLLTGQQPNRPFIDLSDLTGGFGNLEALEKMSFFEAYTVPLRRSLERWHADHPMKTLVQQSVAAGLPPVLRRMSVSRLEAFLSEQVSALRRTKDEPIKRAMRGVLRDVLWELDRRKQSKKVLDIGNKRYDFSPMQIAKELKAARKRLGKLTQEEASKVWGVNLATLRSWEQGVSAPRGLALRQLELILRSARQSRD